MEEEWASGRVGEERASGKGEGGNMLEQRGKREREREKQAAARRQKYIFKKEKR